MLENSSTLQEVQSHFSRMGWDTSVLDRLTMQMSETAVAASQQGGAQQGGAQQPQGGAQQGGSGGAGAGTPEGGQGSETEYSLANGFLGRVPEEHRALLEPYVKQWDAGITRRFQELQSRYAPYEELGDVEELQQAVNYARLLEANPWAVYGVLEQALRSGEFGPRPQGQPQGQQQGAPQGQPQPVAPQGQDQGLPGSELTNLPPAVQQQLAKVAQLEQTVLALGQHILGQQSQQQQAQEDEQLDNYLSQLHEEFGDFDDQWVLMKVYNDPNTPVEQHVQAWSDLINQRVQGIVQKNGNVPNLLGGGGGAPPADAASVKGLSRSDTKSLVASILASTAANGGSR